ncbi:MAG: hypothetical protein R3C71_09610 [Candidatus Krumholzibacteriia bacterium]|nr:hypothetical protein [bacterium]MCB9517240.1 hypothetical protein [Candidatus Latescibacterota bacterium]
MTRIVRAALALIAVLAAAPALADGSFPLYFDWGPPLHDFLDLGGGLINPNLSCSNAHDNLAVAGFDRPGEWIEIAFTLTEARHCVPGASFKSEDGVANRLLLELRPAAGGDALGGEIHYVGSGTD